jgi:5,10-methylenetetrahydromethanopterin reductase
MTAVPFDFAFIPAGPTDEVVEIALLGERLGFRGVWIPDQGFHRDPFVVLSAIAERTSTILLGVGITTPYTRHPVQLARAAGALAELSHGRFLLGLGTGNVGHVVRPMGIEYGRPVQTLRDAVDVVRRLLAGEAVSLDEREQNVQLEFAAEPDIPIYFGTRAPRMLELAGGTVDGVLADSVFNADALPYVVSHVSAGLDAASRGRSAFDLVAWQLVLVAESTSRLLDNYRAWTVRSIQAGPKEVIALTGIDPAVIDAVLTAPSEAEALRAVTDEAVQCVMVAGDSDAIVHRLTEILKRGANSIAILGTGALEDVAANLTKIGTTVLPAFS